MGLPTDVVVAGSKAFALALFAPITERAGTRPRIAVDPGQALALCGDAPGLLVVEYDPRWLPALQQLHRQAPGRRVVAALARGQEAAALALAPLAIDAVPWDGHAASVLAGVERALGPATTVPNAAAAPGRPRPPATSPAATAVPAAARASATAPVLPRAPAVPVSPRTAPPAPVPAPVAAIQPPAPAPSSSAGVTGLFDDLEAVPTPAAEPPPAAVPVEAPVAPAAAAPLAAPAASTQPPPYTATSTTAPPAATAWPVGIPGVDEAEGALVMALRGRLRPDAPLAALAERTLAAMSDLERGTLGGVAQALGAGPVLRAAVMRFRVAAAIATAPRPPAAVDGEAVAALMAELDVVLAEVNGLAVAAPEAQQPALAAIRNALVKEAVDFSEAAHLSSVAPTGDSTPRAGRATAARVVVVHAAEAPAPRETRRRTLLVAALSLAVLAAAGYHAWRWYQKEQAMAALPTIAGAPPGMMLLPSAPGSPRVLVPVRRPDRVQVERFKADQAQRGFTVTEDKAGVLTVTPQDGGRSGGAGRTP